jgi:hypothetical protein
MTQKKICSRPDCRHGGRPQPLSNFSARSGRGDDTGNPRSYCRDCNKRYMRTYNAFLAVLKADRDYVDKPAKPPPKPKPKPKPKPATPASFDSVCLRPDKAKKIPRSGKDGGKGRKTVRVEGVYGINQASGD